MTRLLKNVPTAALIAATLLFVVVGEGWAVEGPPPLKCSSQNFGPFLDFEFRFFSGGQIGLPIKHYRGRQPSFKMLLTVTPVEGTPGEAAELFDEFAIKQKIPDDAKGEMVLSPSFSIGEGRYAVEWKLEDDSGQTCTGAWKIKAALARGQKVVALALKPGEIVESGVYLFRPEAPVARPHLKSPKRLKIFVSMDIRSRRGRSARPSLWRLHPHFSTVRQLSRSQGFNEFSLVFFSFEDQKILYRQDYQRSVNFAPMRKIIGNLNPQTVDINQLGNGREMDFFESLLSDELLIGDAPDAVVFVGQETHFGTQTSEFMQGRLRQTEAAFAFLDTSRYEWRGAMGNVVRAVNGKEYKLRQPTDLSKALDSIERELGGAGAAAPPLR